MKPKPGSRAWTLDVLAGWAARGWLRPLDLALVRFVADLSAEADGPTLLAVALTAHLEGQGHTCLVLPELLADPASLLGWSSDATDALRFVLARMPASTAAWRDALAASAVVDGSRDAVGDAPFVLDDDRFYLRRYWRYERRIATACRVRAETAVEVDATVARSCIERLFDRQTEGEVDWQKVACALALRARIAIVTGGPGTGKTYTAARLIALSFATARDPATLRVALAAPTGKAAARLRQSIDAAFAALEARVGDALPLRRWAGRIGPARTLHALLGTQRRTRRFRHDAAHPLDVDLLIVDEASMVHVEMMDALLAALPADATLVLVGDKDQLSSVEAGAVLGELCGRTHDGENDVANDAAGNSAGDGAGRYTDATIAAIERLSGQRIGEHDPHGAPLAQQTCLLRRSERFGGAIARFADAVNAGRADEARAALVGGDGTVAIVDAASVAAAIDHAWHGYAVFLAAFGARPDSLLGEDHDDWVRRVLDAFEAFRALCAVREGEWGIAGVNRAIERAAGFVPDDDGWYPGRPVIATRNDGDLGIYNGDVGVALPSSPTDPRLRVWFQDGGGVRSVAVGRLAAVETAFAMTVHRAQGSEFDAVMLVLPPDGRHVVTRELLYTGVTRARGRFTLVSSRREALDEAIARTTRRASGIAAMLRAPGR